jgi:magnesium chelatase subunit I
VPGLEKLARKYVPDLRDEELASAMEFVLEGLHQNSVLARSLVNGKAAYSDMVRTMMEGLGGRDAR